jgi:hypothetical protein
VSTHVETICGITVELGDRGTSDGLVWLVEVCERTTVPMYRLSYPLRVEGRIIDAGVDRGSFGWHIHDIDDAAYVLAPGVKLPDEVTT